ncbi:TlpA family protein disulfide reductase [Moheibacter sediminis]|uniref:Thiol-disulfide isomerase or thioredoxin n=1 Tax=Moheibacter sediminis TaxID=1434700 RepID=A0A1W2C1H9_9FLAO|nr:TlpA disulfide reductase family protein [Moheibacter sediminis]SMC78864.1 Thiol-disulfide isomerase or thioredoxin [Moheibacter sediminis]
MKKSILLLFFFIFRSILNAQVTYYITTDSIKMTEENYLQIKKEMNERKDLVGKYQEILIKSDHGNDTIIKTIKFEKITFAIGKNQKFYDPYAEQRKLIGSHFPIELFRDENDNYYDTDFLKGKPTVVNFWFTNCPPCIEEIPDLYKLKKEYDDSVNFIAITFESRKKVNKFLEKKPFFNFYHIPDSQKPINKLKVESYPITFLLNKEGEIVNIYGGNLFFQMQNLKNLLGWLK